MIMDKVTNVVKACDQVCGKKVKNKSDQNLGKIKEIMLDKVNGHVVYVVLDTGILGIGGKYFALPWSIFHYDDEDDSFCVDISEERLKQAPGFDKDNWPDMADRTWGKTVHEYYGSKPYWE